MPPAKKAPSRRQAALRINSPARVPEDPEDSSYPFALGGEDYTARMPKDYVWMELFAATAADATVVQKAQANSLFLQACLSEPDRERIKARMMKPVSVDPVRGMELIAIIKDLVQRWEEPMKREFDIALERAGAN